MKLSKPVDPGTASSDLSRGPPTLSLYGDSPRQQLPPRTCVERWLLALPDSEVQTRPVDLLSRQASVLSSSYPKPQAALPLGADAATMAQQTSRGSPQSRKTQRSHRSGHSSVRVPLEVFEMTHKLTENFVQVANQNRIDAMQREQDMRKEADKQREEAQKQREDTLQREKILLQARAKTERLSAEKDRSMAEKERWNAEILFQREKFNDEIASQREKMQAEAQERERKELDVAKGKDSYRY